MKKSDVIAHVAEAADVSRKTATKMIEALGHLASTEAKKGFTLPGLGKLVRKNPKEGRARIPPTKVVRFRMSRAAKAAILGETRSRPATTSGIPTIEALHDATTGRVDAVRVACYLNESLAFIAAALGRNYSTVAKTPAAVALQERLRDFKRVIEVLEHVLGSAEAVRIWMHTPHPDLDDETPREVIATGKVEVVRRMIDGSLSGNLS